MRPEDFPEDQRGCALSPAERVKRVMQEMVEKDSECGVNSWEHGFLKDNKDSTYRMFTPRMEAVMQKIEAKVFPEDRLFTDSGRHKNG